MLAAAASLVPIGRQLLLEGVVARRTLFGQIVLKTQSSQAENVATKALHHLLTSHPESWPRLREYLATAGIELPQQLLFSTQAWSASDGAIPDLEGRDSKGVRLILESKFWASLTKNQPVTYLRRLPSGVAGAVLFVAPGQRFASLWDILMLRCREERLELSGNSDSGPEFRTALIDPKHRLGLVSWRSLLGSLLRAAKAAGDEALASDVEQLDGLCNAMDDEAFLPLTSEDLSPSIGRRVQQYPKIIEDAVEELKVHHGAIVQGLGTTLRYQGRNFVLEGVGCFLLYWPEFWAKGETPLWLQVSEVRPEGWFEPPAAVTEALLRMFSEQPTWVVADARPCVAMQLPLGVELRDVVSAVVRQVREVAATCREAVGQR